MVKIHSLSTARLPVPVRSDTGRGRQHRTNRAEPRSDGTTDTAGPPAPGRVVGFTLVLAGLLLLGLAAIPGGAAAQQSAPDCSNVSYAQNSSGFHQVSNASQLQCMGNASTSTSLSDDFVLTQDVDASDTATWNGGDGFAPVGTSTNGFAGTFDGNGFTISGLTVDRNGEAGVGLFGRVASGGTVTGTTLEGASVTGSGDVGAIVGVNAGTVRDSAATGQVTSDATSTGGLVGANNGRVAGSVASVDVTGDFWAGGLAGSNDGTVTDSSAGGPVTGTQDVGGLVGHNDGTVTDSSATGTVEAGNREAGGLVGDHDGDISGSSAAGDVSADGDVGGLAGTNSGTVTDSAATGDADATNDEAGGLVGSNEGPLRDSYATGAVSADDQAGGLVGENEDAIVADSYAVGDVSGSTNVGGLVGDNAGPSPDVKRTYAAGEVSGSTNVGGLVGNGSDAAVEDSYWDTESTKQSASAGGTGLPCADMTGSDAETNMAGFDFGSTWAVDAGSYPYLQDNSQSPAPSASCTAGDSEGGDAGPPTLSDYSVTVDGERIVVAFESDENLVAIDVRISGAESARLDREDFSGNVYEGFRATYDTGTDGEYTVELVSARDSSNEEAVGNETFSETVSVDARENATATPTATPADTDTPTTTPADTDTDNPTATETGTADEAETSEPSPTETPTGTDGDGAGFGVVVALAAIAVAGYALRRSG